MRASVEGCERSEVEATSCTDGCERSAVKTIPVSVADGLTFCSTDGSLCCTVDDLCSGAWRAVDPLSEEL